MTNTTSVANNSELETPVDEAAICLSELQPHNSTDTIKERRGVSVCV